MTTNAKDFAAINGFYDTLPLAEPKPGLLRRTATALIGFVRAYLERRTLRSTVRVLQGMDDRMLADIGMTRGEIHSIVYSAGSDATRRSWTITQ
ncbi:MAG: DUF1127 domain-containing protein [Hyphomicrobiaceae bacterium]|jgi:uncharacterized protein YjiS (DUF1127 family)